MALFHEGVRERDISRAIVTAFSGELLENLESDAIIVGAGPSGLVAAWQLAKRGYRTLIIEQNNYLGGGFWVGGYLMNVATFRHPAEQVLDELGIRYSSAGDGLFITGAPYAASKLVCAALEAGAKVLNLTQLDDLVVRDGRVQGVVVNWSPVGALPRNVTCVDPIALEAKVVIDASGHDSAAVKRLDERGIIKIPGMAAMWVERSEDAIVEHTSEVYPGLIVAGMAVAETFGLPRPGPTFGAMLLSGKKAAELAAKVIDATRAELLSVRA
jgi:thiamine thiazole synthase